MHCKDVAHQDLKPANILVSNQHYCQLTKQEIEKAWVELPLICKLADFGESQSNEVQTHSILNSQPSRVNRGTPVYMAPEILVGRTRLPIANLEDKKRADIWGLGIPYHRELERAMEKGQTCLQRLETMLADQKVPIEPIKYQHKHATDWHTIHLIYQECTQFHPEQRPTIKKVILMIDQLPTVSSIDIHLQVSQASSLECFDSNVAHIVAKDGNCAELSQPDNNGSNACAFLSVQIAHEIHRLHQEEKGSSNRVWQSICNVAERVILELPRVINPHRKVEEFYDVQAAFTLIRNIGAPIDEYQFSEEFLTEDYVFSQKGRENLIRALSSQLFKGKFSVGLYTCHTVIFTIGFINECFFIVDTCDIVTLS